MVQHTRAYILLMIARHLIGVLYTWMWGERFGFPLGPAWLKIQPFTVVKGIKTSAKW